METNGSTPEPGNRPARSGWLLLFLLPLGCCGLPLLVAGGAALGAVLGPAVGGVALSAVTVYALATWRRRHARATGCCAADESASTVTPAAPVRHLRAGGVRAERHRSG